MIEGIRAKLAAGDFEFSRHASDGSLRRGINLSEVREAVANAEVIEDYPDDKYGPSCLLFGRTLSGRTLHVLITLYEPDAALWIDCRIRRKVR